MSTALEATSSKIQNLQSKIDWNRQEIAKSTHYRYKNRLKREIGEWEQEMSKLVTEMGAQLQEA